MSNIKNFKVHKLENPKFIHPMSFTFEQSGRQRRWEAVKSHDSVAVLLYHTKKDAFLLVKQFRPAVYFANNQEGDGITYELCAGLKDKDLDEFTITSEEIDEECGYDVKPEHIERITAFYTAVGFSGGLQTVFYAEINDDLKIHEGGGIESEEIELYYLPLNKAKEFVFDESKPKTPGLIFSFYWFFQNKLNRKFD